MALTPPGRRNPPKRPSQERIDRLNALAELHDEWVAVNADAAGFDPAGRPKRSDYNVHHVDLAASDGAGDTFAAEAAAIFGDTASRARGDDDELHHYWTRGEGRAKWAESPTPWTTLVAHLTKHVGVTKAKVYASRWFIEVFGYAAGSDRNRVAHGHPPRGDRVGPG